MILFLLRRCQYIFSCVRHVLRNITSSLASSGLEYNYGRHNDTYSLQISILRWQMSKVLIKKEENGRTNC